jgi:hypothetical protein
MEIPLSVMPFQRIAHPRRTRTLKPEGCGAPISYLHRVVTDAILPQCHVTKQILGLNSLGHPPDATPGGADPNSPIRVNKLGRFYTDRHNYNSVGGFSAGSFGAQMVILLHEVAHKVVPPGFISNDADTPGASEKNTQTVVDHCLHAILEAIDAQKQ